MKRIQRALASPLHSLFSRVRISHSLCKSSFYLYSLCFAGCSFAWPSVFAASSYIFSISIVRNDSLAKLLIVVARWCMSVAQATADLVIILNTAVRKQTALEIARPNGVSLICITIEYAAVGLTVWLIHVCISNAGMSRGKDKSSDKVKWNMSAGCSKYEQISTDRLIHKPNLGAKT